MAIPAPTLSSGSAVAAAEAVARVRGAGEGPGAEAWGAFRDALDGLVVIPDEGTVELTGAIPDAAMLPEAGAAPVNVVTVRPSAPVSPLIVDTPAVHADGNRPVTIALEADAVALPEHGGRQPNRQPTVPSGAAPAPPQAIGSAALEASGAATASPAIAGASHLPSSAVDLTPAPVPVPVLAQPDIAEASAAPLPAYGVAIIQQDATPAIEDKAPASPSIPPQVQMPAVAPDVAVAAVAIVQPITDEAEDAQPEPSSAGEGRKPVRRKEAAGNDQANTAPVSAPFPTPMVASASVADVPATAGDAGAADMSAEGRTTARTAQYAATPAPLNTAATSPDGTATDAGAEGLSTPLFTQTLAAAEGRHMGTTYPQGAAGQPSVTLREGRFGADIGVTIARAIEAGREDLMIRLDPRDMGRVDVRLSFDRVGTLRAVVSADSPVALDLLRRESAHLDRALSDAGIRADSQSLRFDGGAGSGAGGGQDRSGARAQHSARQTVLSSSDGADGADPIHRPLRGSGHVDLMA